MMHLIALSGRSAWNRRLTLSILVVAIAISVALLIAVERIREQAREGFAQSVSGTDLVVGARTSPLQLMLYAVFRLGDATHNIRWTSYQAIAEHPAVAWAVPLSLGDSHRGFAVLGTLPGYFEHFRYGDKQALAFTVGHRFEGVFDVVLGAEVAQRLDYKLGDRIVLAHGTGEVSLSEHADKPFTVTGILAPTGTPVDRTLHVSLAAIEAIHLDWQGGAPLPGLSIPAEYVGKFDLAPKTLTAALVGLKNRAGVFAMQRFVNEYKDEPLLAVLPGVALDELWRITAVAERALLAVSALVVAVGLAGLIAVMLSGINERRRELAILRANGARPRDIFALLTLEGMFVVLSGTVLGVALLIVATWGAAPWLQAHYGLAMPSRLIASGEWRLLAVVFAVGLAASLLPGWRGYRASLADGLSPKI